MSAPEVPLQKAVVDTLKAHAGLTALIGARVYDSVPRDQGGSVPANLFPYVRASQVQIVDAEDACHGTSEAYVTVHVWSRVVGQVEAKRIGAQVRAALNADLSVQGFETIDHRFEGARYLDDPDPTVTHGVIEFAYFLEPVA